MKLSDFQLFLPLSLLKILNLHTNDANLLSTLIAHHCFSTVVFLQSDDYRLQIVPPASSSVSPQPEPRERIQGRRVVPRKSKTKLQATANVIIGTPCKHNILSIIWRHRPLKPITKLMPVTDKRNRGWCRKKDHWSHLFGNYNASMGVVQILGNRINYRYISQNEKWKKIERILGKFSNV